MAEQANDKSKADAKAQPQTGAKPQAAEPKQTRIVAQWKYGQPFLNCKVDPTGAYVVASSEDRSLQRFSVDDGKRVALSGHLSWTRGLAFTPDGKTLISGGYDGRLIWWPLVGEKPEPARQIDRAHDGWIRDVAISPDGTRVATVGNDLRVRLWNVDDGEPIAQFDGHESHVYGVTFDPTGEHVVTGDLHGHIKQWHIADGKPVRDLEASDMTKYDPTFRAQYGGVRQMSFSPDGADLLCAGLHKCTNAFAGKNEPIVVRFDWESGKVARSHASSGVQGIAWAAADHEQDFVVAGSGGSSGGYLLFWKRDQDKPFHKLKMKNTVRGFDLHPDGLRIATAHHDGHFRLAIMQSKGA